MSDLANKKERSVLLICTAGSPGGMERVVLDLTRELRARGWRARALFPAATLADGFAEWAAAQGIEAELSDAVLDAAAEHSRADMDRLRRVIAQEHPDIVHFHYGSSFVSIYDILAARLAGVKRVYATLHQAVAWEEMEPRKKRMTGICGKWLLRRVIAICTQSLPLLDQAGIPKSKVKLIYCGVRMPETRMTQETARLKLGIEPGAFVLLSVAGLVPRKAVDDIIRAAAQVPDSLGSLRLLIAGDGPERAALEAQAAQAIPGKALFLDHVLGDMSSVYAAADIFILASLAEGVPLVCHEAALAGLARIATDVGGTSEAIVDGATGILVQPRAPEQIARAIRILRDDPVMRRELGAAAQLRARDAFSDAAMANAHVEEFLR